MSITRRDFFKLNLLSLTSGVFSSLDKWLPWDEQSYGNFRIGRITTDWINVYPQPGFLGNRTGWKRRDRLVPILEEIESPNGPNYNPTWYKTSDGYVHSGYVQLVGNSLNDSASTVSKTGQLGEISIAFSDSKRFSRLRGWYRFYRLYYGSVHWITDVISSPTGADSWYEITDERLRVHYYVPSSHVRLVDAEEIKPISQHVDPGDKRIEVSLERQELTAFEGNRLVYRAKVATGLHSEEPTDNGIPTDTPTGRFHIANKMPVRHMGNGDLVSDLGAYELPGVPWVSYFVSTGVAFHGTYWHNNFGKPMSHGCVNMRNEDAKWLFRWCAPTMTPSDWYKIERGTKVDIFAS